MVVLLFIDTDLFCIHELLLMILLLFWYGNIYVYWKLWYSWSDDINTRNSFTHIPYYDKWQLFVLLLLEDY